jgi:integrase
VPKASKTGIRGLYRGEDGRYRIDLRWRTPAGEPRRHKEKLPPGVPAAAAKKRAQDVLTAALGGALGNARGPRTLRKAFDDYLDWVKGAGAGEYVDADRAHTDKSLHADVWIEAVGDTSIANLGPRLFDKFKEQQAASGVGPATINRRLGTMKHFLARASSWGWIDKARALELRDELKALPEPDARLRWLKDDERTRLDRELPKELRAVVEAAAYSGLRLSSVIGMLKADVDLKARSLAVWAKRKGQRKRLVLPIGDALAAVLEAAIARSKCDHVFVNRLGEPYTMWGVSGLFRKVVARAKIKDFTFHDLRHDFATRLRRARVPIEDIKDLLGHADVKTTMRYAHVGDPALHAAVANVIPFAPSMPPASKSPQRRKLKS